LTLTDDAGLLRWYRSSQPSRRGFCSRCGTTLFFESTLAPGEVHIARALVPGAIDREPSGHCFSEQSVAWLTVADTLPHYDSDSDALAHYRVIPTLD
ncbi:MAG: hypothetical protein KC609_19505, partial [Myxococcales bacterium]|nr:hypothetical protein [Myxococcales bacterium]